MKNIRYSPQNSIINHRLKWTLCLPVEPGPYIIITQWKGRGTGLGAPNNNSIPHVFNLHFNILFFILSGTRSWNWKKKKKTIWVDCLPREMDSLSVIGIRDPAAVDQANLSPTPCFHIHSSLGIPF